MSDLKDKQRKLLAAGIGPEELLYLVKNGPPDDDISPLALGLAYGTAARLGLKTDEELRELARTLECHGA